MIRRWFLVAGVHLAFCLMLTLAVVIAGPHPAWLPPPLPLDLLTAVMFLTGPLLGFVIAAAGPTRRSGNAPGARVVKRMERAAVLVLLVPVGLVIAAAGRSPEWLAAGGAIAFGSAGLLALLSPWMALYARWFEAR